MNARGKLAINLRPGDVLVGGEIVESVTLYSTIVDVVSDGGSYSFYPDSVVYLAPRKR